MNADTNHWFHWFKLTAPRSKIQSLPEVLAKTLDFSQRASPEAIGRDVRVVAPSELPPKPGLSRPEGQARLLHDLASIELQAMELAVRTLSEFPEAPKDFRQELADLALSEGRHLGLCLEHLENLGFPWGSWDVHLSLWNLVSAEDSLVDRVLIVHRYLEGSGLDAGDSILRRLQGVASKAVRNAVGTIVNEEVDHVRFGSLWYRRICEAEHLDPDKEFARRIPRIARLAPRRERLSHQLRLKAGFNQFELTTLENLAPAPV